VKIPKAGWVRFRWSRQVPAAKSYRITLDRAGRWHVAFAAVPEPVPAPCSGKVVAVDRGVAVSAALSTGTLHHAPRLRETEHRRLLRLQRKAARRRVRGRPPSGRLRRTYAAIGRLRAREADRRKDWAEKLSTGLARQFDLIRVEDLQITRMTRSAEGTPEAPGRSVSAKAGLNREILASGWGLLVCRLEQKAPARVEKINPAYTSQCCSACGTIAAEARESQARFRCRSCKYTANADVNAARNIAAGHAVTARGGPPLGGPANREPQPSLHAS
jgi:putative transposase